MKVKDLFKVKPENIKTIEHWLYNKYGEMEEQWFLDKCNNELRNGGPGKDWIRKEYNIHLRKEKLNKLNEKE